MKKAKDQVNQFLHTPEGTKIFNLTLTNPFTANKKRKRNEDDEVSLEGELDELMKRVGEITEILRKKKQKTDGQ